MVLLLTHTCQRRSQRLRAGAVLTVDQVLNQNLLNSEATLGVVLCNYNFMRILLFITSE